MKNKLKTNTKQHKDNSHKVEPFLVNKSKRTKERKTKIKRSLMSRTPKTLASSAGPGATGAASMPESASSSRVFCI